MGFTKESFLICNAKFFDVCYEINPWMSLKRRPKQSESKLQWDGFEKKHSELGSDLHHLTPQDNMPDLVFTANHGLVKDNKVVTAKLKYPERQVEEVTYTDWFKSNGFEIFEPNGIFEGEGDAFIVGDTLFYGYGIRSEKDVAEEIKDFFGLSKIVYAKLVNDYFYHFDTCFAPLNKGKALIYSEAIDPDACKELSNYFDLIEVGQHDGLRFACNAVPIGENVILPFACKDTQNKLRDAGLVPHGVKLSQFMKAGGLLSACVYVSITN